MNLLENIKVYKIKKQLLKDYGTPSNSIFEDIIKHIGDNRYEVVDEDGTIKIIIADSIKLSLAMEGGVNGNIHFLKPKYLTNFLYNKIIKE